MALLEHYYLTKQRIVSALFSDVNIYFFRLFSAVIRFSLTWFILLSNRHSGGIMLYKYIFSKEQIHKLTTHVTI